MSRDPLEREPVRRLRAAKIGRPEAEDQVRRAWQMLRPAAPAPDRVEVLVRKKKSAVCRLEGPREAGFPLIAKRARLRTSCVERSLYAQILPQIPVQSLAWHGAVETGREEGEDEEFCWLFLEDAGGNRIDPRNPAHRRLAASWLAGLHTASRAIDAVSALPDRGPDDALGRLRSGRLWLQRGLASSHPPADRPGVRAMLELLDVVESSWHEVEAACAAVPKTLVHGDFGKKNVSVRAVRSGPEIRVYDFEHAGYGFPGQDLGLADLPCYAERVRAHWPGVDVQRMFETGSILRILSSVRWASRSLGRPGSLDAEANLALYARRLESVVARVGWSRSRA